MVIDKKTDILLESGTNELEVMEFTIGSNNFGINVAKVMEIMQYNKVVPMPNSNPFVEGVFKPREEVITVINLASYMGLPPSESEDRDILIITNFNKMSCAFHVHSVEAIHRISWSNIEKPDPSIYGGEEGLATGIARFDGRLITLVDFEKIISDISPTISINVNEIDKLGERHRNKKPILIAEDSPMLERLITESLERANYVNLTRCNNGQEAWDTLNEYKHNADMEDKDIYDLISCVITDIEMPQMDGHRLLKLIRDDSKLKDLPVIIFSSLINDDMRKKGESLGATAQISKPEISKLVTLLDKYL